MTLDMGEGVSEGVISKLAFLHWTPEGAGALSKMMSSQAKESFMKKLDGNLVCFNLYIAKFTHKIPFF